MADREDHPLPLGQRDDLDPRLHARALLGQHKFAPVKSVPGRESRNATWSGKTCSP